jgi:hypothetical protein
LFDALRLASAVGDGDVCATRLFGEAVGWAVELALSVFEEQPNCANANTTAANMPVI